MAGNPRNLEFVRAGALVFNTALRADRRGVTFVPLRLIAPAQYLDVDRSARGRQLIRFIAANGDRLDATFLGQATPTGEPNVASIVDISTITGGTGRFASATGTFTIHRVLNQVTGVSTGSFDGMISPGH